MAKLKLVQVAEEIVSALLMEANADVQVTVEVSAEFPGGVSDETRRVVTENASSVEFGVSEWE